MCDYFKEYLGRFIEEEIPAPDYDDFEDCIEYAKRYLPTTKYSYMKFIDNKTGKSTIIWRNDIE